MRMNEDSCIKKCKSHNTIETYERSKPKETRDEVVKANVRSWYERSKPKEARDEVVKADLRASGNMKLSKRPTHLCKTDLQKHFTPSNSFPYSSFFIPFYFFLLSKVIPFISQFSPINYSSLTQHTDQSYSLWTTKLSPLMHYTCLATNLTTYPLQCHLSRSPCKLYHQYYHYPATLTPDFSISLYFQQFMHHSYPLLSESTHQNYPIFTNVAATISIPSLAPLNIFTKPNPHTPSLCPHS